MARVPVKAGLFEPLDDPARLHLIGGLCGACLRRHFPTQETCPYCGAGGCEVTALTRSGVIYLCTTVTSRPPGYDGPVPFGFGVVELGDGIRVISRIIDPDAVACGTAVEITLDTVGRDGEGREIVTYAFRPKGNQPPVSDTR